MNPLPSRSLSPIRSLSSPWWDWWVLMEWKNPYLPWAFRQIWAGNLQELCGDRGISYSTLAKAMDREYHWLRRQITGEAYSTCCTPVLEFYKMSKHLGVEVHELLPQRDEVYRLATRSLLREAVRLTSAERDRSHAPPAERGRDAAQAYVTYHNQRPSPKGYDSLDPEAVEQTCLTLAGRFRSVQETAELLHATGLAIDSISFTIGGTQ